jgi:hypothetical protein
MCPINQGGLQGFILDIQTIIFDVFTISSFVPLRAGLYTHLYVESLPDGKAGDSQSAGGL